MNRRSFLKAMVGGVAAAAAVRTFPFRVYSFPPEVKTPVVAIISEYHDFYSTVIWPGAIDEVVHKAAQELGYRAGLSIDTIVAREFGLVT